MGLCSSDLELTWMTRNLELAGLFFHPMVYLSLLPIIGGVGIASLEELSFTWLAFASAMCSNVFSASRGLVGKGLMGRFPAQNLYALMTLIAAVVITPISLCVESPRMIITAVKASLAGAQLAGSIFYGQNCSHETLIAVMLSAMATLHVVLFDGAGLMRSGD
jgi:hypothetical protein